MTSAREQLEVKKSQFISSLARASTPEQAQHFLTRIRTEFSGASHHCYAFIAGSPESTESYGSSDDGEVSGTASRPMLQLLESGGFGEIIVVVTRFYGGINLGAGGLLRAYSQVARKALDSAKFEKFVPLTSVVLSMAFSDEALVRHIIARVNGTVLSVCYTSSVSLTAEVPHDRISEFESSVSDSSKGSIKIIRQ